MNETELKSVILDGLKQIAPANVVDELRPDEKFLQKLDLDSFDHLNFLTAISGQLGIDIPEKDYGKLDTLQHIVEYLAVKAV
jgi:acyl carrier protein